MPRAPRPAAAGVALTTARTGLSMYWRGAVLAVLAGTVALAAAGPVVAVAGGLDLNAMMGGFDRSWSPQATPIVVFQRQALRALLAPLLAAAGGVLALAAITILVESVARAVHRSGEIGVRRAVGASRRALAAMAVAEASLLAGAALLAGAGLASAGYQLARGGWPGTTTAASLVPVALIVAAFLGTFLLGALFVLVPARQHTVRVASGPPLELYLAAALLAAGLIVVTSSALLARHVDSIAQTPATQHRGDGTLYQVESEGVHTRDYAALLAQLGVTPGVEVASVSSPGLAVGLGEVGGLTTDCGDCSEANLRLPFRLTTAVRHLVSVDTFRAIGARVIAGRGITALDVAGSARVAVVNRALAARHFQHGEPIGRRLQLDGIDGWYTVVGIVDEAPAVGFGAGFLPRYAVYLSVLQHPAARVELLVRGPDGADVGATIARYLSPTHAPIAIAEAGVRAAQLAPLRWMTRWLAVEGWAGWIIAALGTLILVRLWIGALIPELGIRRAIGARQRTVFITVVGRAMLAGCGGLACALWFGPGAWQAVTGVVPALPSWDSGLLLRYGLILVAIAVAAALPGAWRAMRAGPAELMQQDDR